MSLKKKYLSLVTIQNRFWIFKFLSLLPVSSATVVLKKSTTISVRKGGEQMPPKVVPLKWESNSKTTLLQCYILSNILVDNPKKCSSLNKKYSSWNYSHEKLHRHTKGLEVPYYCLSPPLAFQLNTSVFKYFGAILLISLPI